MKHIFFKGFFCSLALLFCAPYCFSVPATLDSVCAALKEHAITTGDFSQEKTVPNVRRPLKSTGTFLFCAQGLVWNTARPIRSSLTVTPERVIQSASDGSKTVLDGSSSELFLGIARSVSSLFSGNRADLERYFDVDFVATEEQWTMALTPKDKTIASVIKAICVTGSGTEKDASFESLKIEELDKSSILYTFTNQAYKEQLSDEEKSYFSTE